MGEINKNKYKKALIVSEALRDLVVEINKIERYNNFHILFDYSKKGIRVYCQSTVLTRIATSYMETYEEAIERFIDRLCITMRMQIKSYTEMSRLSFSDESIKANEKMLELLSEFKSKIEF
jgi:hypothetical protein